MELETFFTLVQYAMIGIGSLVFLAVIWIALNEYVLDLGKIKDEKGKTAGFIFTVFKFGFVYAKPNTRLHFNLNKIRETEGQQWFMSAPEWFNKHVFNVNPNMRRKDRW